MVDVGKMFTDYMSDLFAEAFVADMRNEADGYMTNVFIFEACMEGVKRAVDEAVLGEISNMLIEGIMASFAGGFQQEWV